MGVSMVYPGHCGKAISVLGMALWLAGCATTESGVKPAAPSKFAVAPEHPGFTRVVRNGVEQFCQSRNPTGSRVRVAEQCYTAEEMQRLEKEMQDFFKDAGMSGSHDTLHMDSPR